MLCGGTSRYPVAPCVCTVGAQEAHPAGSDPQTLQLVAVVPDAPQRQVCCVHTVIQDEGLELGTELSQLTHTLVRDLKQEV